MSGLLTAVGTVVTSFLTQLGAVSTALLSNEVFQIIMAIAFVSIAFGLVMALVSKIRGGKKRRR